MWRHLDSLAAAIILTGILLPVSLAAEHENHHAVQFSARSIKDGKWSDATTWHPAKVPTLGDRVLISRGTTVEYDVASKEVLRLIQVVGTLSFARDRDTEHRLRKRSIWLSLRHAAHQSIRHPPADRTARRLEEGG